MVLVKYCLVTDERFVLFGSSVLALDRPLWRKTVVGLFRRWCFDVYYEVIVP